MAANSNSPFTKSILHFANLLKSRKFADIVRISSYYFLDKIVRNLLIIGIKIIEKIRPSKQLYYCPFCEKYVPHFYPIICGNHIDLNVQCPSCKSYERHRFQYLYYNNETDLFRPKHTISVLHCAPEELFFQLLENNEKIDYYPVDKCEDFTVCGKRMRDYIDITQIPYEDNTFDYILCNHVLEHIPDEQLALSELKRVLKPDGIAFLNVPIDVNLDHTLENPSYNTDVLRLKYYGQCDHVRKYGNDYITHLEAAGFVATGISAEDYFSKEELKKYVLLPHEQIYCCRK